MSRLYLFSSIQVIDGHICEKRLLYESVAPVTKAYDKIEAAAGDSVRCAQLGLHEITFNHYRVKLGLKTPKVKGSNKNSPSASRHVISFFRAREDNTCLDYKLLFENKEGRRVDPRTVQRHLEQIDPTKAIESTCDFLSTRCDLQQRDYHLIRTYQGIASLLPPS